jgi:hypothetical protein
MKKIMILSFILIMISALPCIAEEYKGEITKMTSSRLEMNVKGAGSRSFQVTRLTRVFKDGEIFPVHHLLPHSKARVVEKDDKVELIILEEVPK